MKYLSLLFFSLFYLSNILTAQLFTQINTGSIATSNQSSGGCSWADFNNDGWPDLYISNTNSNNQLFKNNGDGTFEEITTGNLVNDGGISNSAVWGDYNNDGYLDIFVSNNPPATASPELNFLYKNEGSPDYNFSKIFIPATVEDANYTWSSSWVDFDNDGDLDLHMPDNKHLQKDFFYENNGDESFTTITPVFVTPDVESTGVVSWIDYDHDGDQDLFMIKSGRSHPDNGEDNRMYHNQLAETGNLEFLRITSTDMVNHFDLDFQASWGDYDNDGDMDVYLGNFDNADYLYRNEGDSVFTQINGVAPVNVNTKTLGSTWGDFDNDGDLDLYVLNTGGQASRYFQNDGAGNFISLSSAVIGTAISNLSAAQGCAHADFDNDGYLDLYVANSFFNNNGQNFFYHNNGGVNNYVHISCQGTNSNTSAIGAKVWVKATINGNSIWQLRHITGSPTGNRAQNDLRVHFGLGNAEIIDSLMIEWPSGLKEIYTSIPSNQLLSYTEGGSVATQDVSLAKNKLSIFPNPAEKSTTIGYEINAASQNVQLELLDSTQKIVAIIFSGIKNKGKHIHEFNLSKLAAGNYFINLKIDRLTTTRPLIIVN